MRLLFLFLHFLHVLHNATNRNTFSPYSMPGVFCTTSFDGHSWFVPLLTKAWSYFFFDISANKGTPWSRTPHKKKCEKVTFSPSLLWHNISPEALKGGKTTTEKCLHFLNALLRRIAYSPRTVTVPLAPQKPPMLEHSLSLNKRKKKNTINHKLVCTPPLNPPKPNAIPTHITTQQQGSPHTRKALATTVLHHSRMAFSLGLFCLSLESCPACTCCIGKTTCRALGSLPCCR